MRLNTSLTTSLRRQGAGFKTEPGPVAATLQNDRPTESLNHVNFYSDTFENKGLSFSHQPVPVSISEVHSTSGEYLKLKEPKVSLDLPKSKVCPDENLDFKFEPQTGFEWLKQLVKHRHEERTATNMLENFMFLCTALYDCTNKRQAAATICLYIKTTYNKSIMDMVRTFLIEQSLFTEEEFPREGLERMYETGDYNRRFDIQAGEESWIHSLRDLNKNWKLIAKSPAFKKVSCLISMCASLGLCNIADMNFSIGGVTLFAAQAHHRHCSILEFGAACLDTVEFFVSGGYECFVNKNYDPLLYEDAGGRQFEEDYFKVLELSNAVKCGNLSKVSDMDENDYGELLDDVLDKCKSYLEALPQGPERRDMAARRDRLGRLRTDYRQYRVSGKLRPAPYGLYFYGTSSVGKSYTASLLSRLVLKANGFACDDDRFLTINEGDRYLSTADSKINCVQVDDIGNTKPDFLEKSPAQKIIELVNNVPYYANMAEVDMKGKISLEPKVVTCTSNLTLTRVANMFSLDTMSITRRMLEIEQFVKPEFRIPGTMMLDGKKVKATFGDDIYPDCYTFIVRRSYNDGGKCGQRNVLREHCGINELINYLIEDSKAHFDNQRFVVENSRDLGSKISLCNQCNKPPQCCKCCDDDVSVDMDAVRNFIETPLPGDEDDGFERQAGSEVRSERRRDNVNMPVDHDWVLKLFYYMPDCIFHNPISQVVQTMLQFNRFLRHVRDESDFYKTCLCIGLYLCYLNIICGLSMIFLTCYFFLVRCFMIHVQMAQYRSIERNFMPSTLAAIRADRYTRLLGTCAAIAITYKLAKIAYSTWKFSLETQGSLSPRNDAEARARMSEKNPWVGAHIAPVPQKLKVDSSHEQLRESLKRNLLYFRVIGEEDVRYCNTIAIKNCRIAFPTHMFLKGQDMLRVEIYRGKAFDANLQAYCKKKVKEIVIYKDQCELIAEDVFVCHAPGVADFSDITKFFPDDVMSSFGAIMMHRNTTGDVDEFDIHCDYIKSVTVGEKTFEAYKYNLPVDTFKGMCMSMVISKTKPSVIAGFHLGGKSGTPLGVAGMTTKQKINAAMVRLNDNNPAILDAHSGGDFPESVYDVKILTSRDVHIKSCMNHLPVDNPLNILGSTIGRASHTKSDVITTPISKDIEEVCNVPKQFGPPQLHPWRNYWETIEKIANPCKGPDAKHIAWAVQDYLHPFTKIMEKPFWKQIVTPLTWMESICGIDGQRFVKKMPRDTSIGFPLSGTKEKHCIFLDPEDHPTHQCPVDMSDMIKAEVSRITEIYKQGERAYPVFKAALKDEPTKIGKTKVRVFFAAPVALQLLVRKYFLPICNFLQSNPLISECAVGINAAGPEWDELSRHMMSHGEDRIFAGDYSAYDTRMPIEVSTAAWNIFIAIAKLSGNYSEEDLTIMRGVATDCCYPVVAYNGDLIQVNGIHISGVNITAAVGGCENSILVRCGYKACHDAELGKSTIPYFRKYVTLVVYGDDFKGSIAKRCTWFDHIKYRDYLATYGMVLTMPDKTSTPTPFMKDADADFLKRKNIFNEETGLYFGALDKDSIFKNLHAVLRSKVITPLEQCAMNIDGALREMFYHGKEDYEVLRGQLREVASRHSIEGECKMLSTTYEDEMLNFKTKYLLPAEEVDPPPDEFEQLVLDCQGGYEGSCEVFPLAVNCFTHENEHDWIQSPTEQYIYRIYIFVNVVLAMYMAFSQNVWITFRPPVLSMRAAMLCPFIAVRLDWIHQFMLYDFCLHTFYWIWVVLVRLLRNQQFVFTIEEPPSKKMFVRRKRRKADPVIRDKWDRMTEEIRLFNLRKKYDIQGGVEEAVREFENITLDQREISREMYEWRHAVPDERSEKCDKPVYDKEKYYLAKRCQNYVRWNGFGNIPMSKWILIPRSKSNFIDLIKNLRAQPAFYQDVIYYQGENVGDVDLGFIIKGDLFIFEIKKSPKRTPRGNAQAKLNLYHLQMMNAGMRIHSFVVRGDIVTHICSNCSPTRKQMRTGLFE